MSKTQQIWEIIRGFERPVSTFEICRALSLDPTPRNLHNLRSTLEVMVGYGYIEKTPKAGQGKIRKDLKWVATGLAPDEYRRQAAKEAGLKKRRPRCSTCGRPLPPEKGEEE